MATFPCTYAELRKLAGEYLKAIRESAPDLDQLDAGLKCVQLHYLGMVPAHAHEVAGAAALLRIVSRHYMMAEALLLATTD